AQRPAHDRAPAVRRVLPQPRLAEGERGRDRDAAAAGGADHAVPAFPEQRTAGAEEMKTQGLFSKSMLGVGFAFLYIPIISMIWYSFNNSRLVTVWDSENSPTLKWYGKLLDDSQVLSAAWLSIQVAAMSATGAVVLGTLAGLV